MLLSRYVIDVEANGLKPTHIWCVVLRNIDTNEAIAYRNPEELRSILTNCTLLVGHNIVGYDFYVLNNLWSISCWDIPYYDTLVLSKLLKFDRQGGHSLEAWAPVFGLKKSEFSDWSKWSQELEDRCISDTLINLKLFNRFLPYVNSENWSKAIECEQRIAILCQELHTNGFPFNKEEADRLYRSIQTDLSEFERSFAKIFPPRLKFVKEITPRATKHGTINRSDFRWLFNSDCGDNANSCDLSNYSVSAPFSLLELVEFNPNSVQQIVERLNEYGWKPTEKTDKHQEVSQDKTASEDDREYYRKYGWKVSEANLSTLPPDSPEAARSLVRYLILSRRLSRLEEWFKYYDLVTKSIHGRYNHIGAWTQRMSHDNPNQGNVPRTVHKKKEIVYGLDGYYSAEMRSLFRATPGNLLIGVDAKGIQLRILAHYMEDDRFTEAVVKGDPHELNREALGEVCKSRDNAKTFIYAWLLGAGVQRVAEILGCTTGLASSARERFIEYYPGLKKLKAETIPRDAARRYFVGFDGRKVAAEKGEHYILGGYLQNGEALVMKYATQIWKSKLKAERIPFWIRNFVHDEWQTETINDRELAEYIVKVQCDAIRQAGVDLGVKCPLDGEGKIGINWLQTH